MRKLRKPRAYPAIVGLSVSILAGAVFAESPAFEFQIVVDQTMPFPGGYGSFAYFSPQPVLDGRKAIFWGGGNGGQFGIYVVDLQSDQMTVVADHTTSPPGTNLHFAELYTGTSARNGVVSFIGAWSQGSTRFEAVYLYDGTIAQVADFQTTIPESSETFQHFQLPANWGRRVLFTGYGQSQSGIYLAEFGLSSIVDRNTLLPGDFEGLLFFNFGAIDEHSEYFFASTTTRRGIFISSGIGPVPLVVSGQTLPGVAGTLTDIGYQFSLADGAIAFVATSQSEEFGQVTGVYCMGPRRTFVADSRTAAPCSGSLLQNFSAVSAYGSRVAFVAETEAHARGLFLDDGQRLLKVATQGDRLGGRVVRSVDLGAGGLSGDGLLFYLSFEDGGQAIVLATLRESMHGDLDRDVDVDLEDLSILLWRFGQTASSSEGDLDGDGIVALSDMARLLAEFGAPCN